MREQWDSGFGVLQNEIPGFKEAHSESLKAKRWLVYFTDQEANQALAKTPYAIGVSDLGMVSTEQLNLRVLALNGVVPNPDNLLNGTYPLSRELIFIYRAEGLSPAARAFLDFVSSKEGSTILRANGYLPLE
jgi:phosphate transport system substrate-binding protein